MGAIINGDVKGNEEEEWTYAREREESVIDYMIGDEKTREKIRSMVVRKKVVSDHEPIIANIERKKTARAKTKGNKNLENS